MVLCNKPARQSVYFRYRVCAIRHMRTNPSVNQCASERRLLSLFTSRIIFDLFRALTAAANSQTFLTVLRLLPSPREQDIRRSSIHCVLAVILNEFKVF